MLPRQRIPPKRLGGDSAHEFEDVKSFFRQQYFHALDVASQELTRRFNQNRGMNIAAIAEKVLIDSCNQYSGNTVSIPKEIDIYENEIELQRLSIQLKMLPDLVKTYNEQTQNNICQVTSLRSLCDIMTTVTSSRNLLSEVYKLLHICCTIPVTSATAERTFSALRRLKTFLRTTMTQMRLNHVAILHTHKEMTDEIDLDSIEREFVSANDRRKIYFGVMH